MPVGIEAEDELTGALLRQLLGALLIRMARLPAPAGRPVPAAPGAEVHLAFRRELEHSSPPPAPSRTTPRASATRPGP
ncbi:hypothetical protein [Streptomyces sp. NPDC059994]|uniref:hypothetical protein n=1 Tax=Streptomyces sp. NPDC059994 TaxID=3347029 RepID=UPI00367FF583